MANRVLIVEDERAIVEILKFNLKKEGYETLEAMDGRTGLEKARSEDPDLILLDLMLPEIDGFEVCRTLRSEGHAVPILMLTAREEESDKVLGLESGADDYITKPFSMRELLARVRANIRRRALDAAPAADSGTLTSGTLVLDPARVCATLDGKQLELSQKEFDLLKFLMSSPGRVFTREELMTRVWNYDFGYVGDTRTVDVTIRRLREKVEEDSTSPARIMTRRGAGYYFAG